MTKATYYPSQIGHNYFKLIKFADGAVEPETVYFVTQKNKGDGGFLKTGTNPQFWCDCPNRRRGKGMNDKHGVMIAKWLLDSKPQGFFDHTGEFHGTGELAANPFEEYLERDDGQREDSDGKVRADDPDDADEADEEHR